jgi:hypothetical protein
LELIEPDHNPSTWRESLDKNGEGPHREKKMERRATTVGDIARLYPRDTRAYSPDTSLRFAPRHGTQADRLEVFHNH